MDKTDILQRTTDFMCQKLSGEGTGHDWYHVERVVKSAKTINDVEGGDPFIVGLGALLHDIEDWKFHDGDTTVGPRAARTWLQALSVEEDIIDKVVYIVEHISYRGGTNVHQMQTLEGKIVQDADRLDSIGAIGIARTFAFGGAAGRSMYDPSVKPKDYANFADFKDQIKGNHTINHFYEKLLLLKDKMNTKTGRDMAESRHQYMEQFLQEFYAEWGGER